MAILGHFMVKLYLNDWFNGLIDFFPLRIGIIKSRFHYFKHQFLVFSWCLDFPTLEPRIYSFHSTKMLQTIQEKYGDILKAYYFPISQNLKIRKFMKFLEGIDTIILVCVSLCFRFSWKISTYIFVYKFVKMRIGKWYISTKKTCQKAWIWISDLSKIWNGNLVNPTNFSVFKEGNHLTLICL